MVGLLFNMFDDYKFTMQKPPFDVKGPLRLQHGDLNPNNSCVACDEKPLSVIFSAEKRLQQNILDFFESKINSLRFSVLNWRIL